MTQVIDEKRTVTIKGREIAVRRLTDAQLTLASREGRLLQKDTIEARRKWDAIGRVLDILESAVVEEADREYLMDLTVARELELADMLPILKAFADAGEQKVQVRRGRPPKRRP
jgi:hypothetical protein